MDATAVHTEMEALAARLNELAAAGNEEFFATFGFQLTHDAIGYLLGALPITALDGARPNVHLAADVADLFSPDWAQAWYRFVVALTKIKAIA
jgi:hypothetical protein